MQSLWRNILFQISEGGIFKGGPTPVLNQQGAYAPYAPRLHTSLNEKKCIFIMIAFKENLIKIFNLFINEYFTFKRYSWKCELWHINYFAIKDKKIWIWVVSTFIVFIKTPPFPYFHLFILDIVILWILRCLLILCIFNFYIIILI